MQKNIAIIRCKNGSLYLYLTVERSLKQIRKEWDADEEVVKLVKPDYSDSGVRAIMAIFDLAYESSSMKMPGIKLLEDILAAGRNL